MNRTTENNIRSIYEKYKQENPKVRIRDAAKALKVTEAELVYSSESNLYLLPDFHNLLNELKELGYVMALTRNEYAVHERKGIYSKAGFHGTIGLVVNPDIDLRLFMKDWKFVFAVNENNRKSIQFFDRFGNAIHKVYLTEKSSVEAYENLLDKFQTDQPDHLSIEMQIPLKELPLETEKFDAKEFHQEWKDLQDTHDFMGILKKHGLSRIQAIQNAPSGFTMEIPRSKIESILNLVSSLKTEIMVFVGNSSCLQIHTGLAQRIVRTGPWINILDEEFNLHLNDQAIHSLWIVKKPTNLGLVHSVEAFDNQGNLIIQFFGKRKPSIPESEDWRLLVQSLTETL